MHMVHWTATAFTAVLACQALADEFILTDESSVLLDGSMHTELDGTLIGDWDGETNPDGTQTRPGVWGGSGNNPIPLSMTVTIGFNGVRVPTGIIDVVIDSGAGLAQFSDLNWNVIGEETLPGTLTVTVLYETFRSINPDSLYPGGVPVEIPMGEATVTACSLLQAGPAPGTAAPIDGQPGGHDVTVTVPAIMDLVIATDAFGELPMQVPIALLLEGVHQIGDATDYLTMTAHASVDETSDLPGEPLPSIPMELPTVVPPGDFAGVLLDLTPTAAGVTLTLGADIQATHQQGAFGDLNGDGIVGTDDLLAILAAWGSCAGCPEDLDGDGVVGVNEILLIIDHWS